MRLYFANELQTLLAYGGGGGEQVTDTTDGRLMSVAEMRGLLRNEETRGYAVVTSEQDGLALVDVLASLEARIVDNFPAKPDGVIVLRRLSVEKFTDYTGEDEVGVASTADEGQSEAVAEEVAEDDSSEDEKDRFAAPLMQDGELVFFVTQNY
ncbi:MAG: hypothetical protein HYV34_04260 [Candidatus Kerfeldbacteria bacterium]|nr:hypothetical protein [Candidatus Kerfeldbacteria bacterium]